MKKKFQPVSSKLLEEKKKNLVVNSEYPLVM